MRKVLLVALVAALAAPGSVFAADREVGMSGTAFQPATTLALPGDTIVWRNTDRFRTHNVTFSDTLRSGDMAPGAEPFSHTFAAPGTFRYSCTLHDRAGMRGSVVVKEIHFAGPTTPLVYGGRATFTGVAPASATVEIQRVTASGAFTVAQLPAAPDGKFLASVPAPLPGQYHATASGRTSALVPLKVRPRVLLATRRSGAAVYVNVSTNPAQVGAPVVLQRRTSSGWARVASARLNSRSKATFRVVPRTATKLRVRLTRGIQGYSPSTSATITVRP